MLVPMHPAELRQPPPGPFVPGLWPGLAEALAEADCSAGCILSVCALLAPCWAGVAAHKWYTYPLPGPEGEATAKVYT